MPETKIYSDTTLRDELSKQSKPLLLAFWAPWSNSCKIMEPVLKELAHDYGKRLQIGIINVDENAHTPAEFGVTNIPHLTLIDRGGQAVSELCGAHPKSKIVEMIEKNLHELTENSL